MSYIHWNPEVSLLDLGFYELRWYSLLFALGFIISYFLLNKMFKKEGVKEEKLEKLTIYVVLATVIGARLGHCLFYDFEYYSQHPLEIFLPFSFDPTIEFTGYRGLASHGGAIGIFIALILYSKYQKIKLFWVLDKLALVVPIAGCCIRLGNLMNSEIIGKPAEVPWAFIFEQVDNVPRHPGQLYEAIAYFIIFIIMNVVNRKVKKENGFLFGLFLVLLFSARFIVEYFKIDQSAFEAGMLLNMGQILSIPFIIYGIYLILQRNNNVEKNEIFIEK